MLININDPRPLILCLTLDLELSGILVACGEGPLLTYACPWILQGSPEVTTRTQPFNNSRNSYQNGLKISENIDMGQT